jgi:hypothetical protein
MEKSMRVWNVWVEQVDQDNFTISANTKKIAREKAKQAWSARNPCQIIAMKEIEQ